FRNLQAVPSSTFLAPPYAATAEVGAGLYDFHSVGPDSVALTLRYDGNGTPVPVDITSGGTTNAFELNFLNLHVGSGTQIPLQIGLRSSNGKFAGVGDLAINANPN